MPLVPCAGCRRHIRIDHAACPFCAASVPADFARRVIPPSRKRLDRLATFSFATTLAVAACGEIEPQPASPSPGVAAVGDAGPDGRAATAPSDAGRDARPEAGADAGRVDDDGGVMAEYGAPPLDAGFDDDGGISADYGQPPVDAGRD